MKTYLLRLLTGIVLLAASSLARGADAPQAFTVTLLTPAPGTTTTLAAPASVKLTTSVSGNANPIVRVDYYDLAHGNSLIGSAAGAPYSVTFSSSTSGSYAVRATAVDSAGTSANSAVAFITVSGTTGGGGGNSTTHTLTVVNGTVYGGGTTATLTAGASMSITANSPPAGQWFNNWSGAQVANSSAQSTTFTMGSSNVVLTANFYTPPQIPQPITSHPRLWITPNDVSRLRTWAVAGNPIYQQGLLQVLNNSVAAYTNQFFPNGVANPNYPDFGDTQGYTGQLSEQHALVFAFFSQIDPNPANRILHAQRARNLIMTAMNQAKLGHLAGVPFRDPAFAIYNRANFTSEAWPLAVDWIYNAVDASSQPILTAADKLTIRNVFLIWANDCLYASTTGGDHPSPVGGTNSPSLLPGGNAYRMAANNYYAGHARLLTLMSLCLDPADDPAVTAGTPDAVLGNTMRSYILNATGAWLYQQYAMFGDAPAVIAAYGLPQSVKVGLASGGLPPEGMLYGHSYAYLFGELLALKTAGFGNTTVSGPQAALVTAPVWDRFVNGFIASLVPSAQIVSGYGYLGPVYQMLAYGDILRIWVTPDFMQSFALLALLDQQNGSVAHLNAASWFCVNGTEGGAANLNKRITQPWAFQESILYFMLLDPNAPAATDPRPAMPLDFVDAGLNRIVSRTSWSPTSTVFDYIAPWISINHEQAVCGQFELYRNGEWLTKELSNYDNNMNGESSAWHNTLSLKNWCSAGTPQLSWFEGPLFASGSQWILGASAGDPVTVSSTGNGYTYAQTDMTKLYNRPNPWTPASALTDIQHASRSILWVNGDNVVVYDRAVSLHGGLFKRYSQNFVTTPVVVGNTVTETTARGQKLFMQTLLPLNPSYSFGFPGNTINPVAWQEPSTCRIVVEDAAYPANVRFLHVFQAGNPGAVAAPSALVQSSAGTTCDGAVFGATLVMFVNDITAPFNGVTYTAPATATTHYITGLTPNAGYNVTEQITNVGVQITVTAGGSFTADAGGVLAFHP